MSDNQISNNDSFSNSDFILHDKEVMNRIKEIQNKENNKYKIQPGFCWPVNEKAQKFLKDVFNGIKHLKQYKNCYMIKNDKIFDINKVKNDMIENNNENNKLNCSNNNKCLDNCLDINKYSNENGFKTIDCISKENEKIDNINLSMINHKDEFNIDKQGNSNQLENYKTMLYEYYSQKINSKKRKSRHQKDKMNNNEFNKKRNNIEENSIYIK